MFLCLIFQANKSNSQNFCVEIIEPRFEKLSSFKNGIAIAKQEGKFGFIDLSGEFIFPPQFDEIDEYDFEGFPAKVKIKGKTGIVDIKGNFLVKPEYDEVTFATSNLYNVKLGNYWLYIDNTGMPVNENRYDSINFGLMWGSPYDEVYQNNKCGLVDSTGTQATSVIYEDIYEFDGEIYALYNNKWGLLGKNGQWKISPEYASFYEFYNGLAVAQLGDNWGLIKKNGTWKIKNIYNYLYYTGEKYIIASSSEYFGIIDTSGISIINQEFDYIAPYKDNKFIASKGEKSGLIDITGNWLCEFMYPYPSHYSHDLFKYDNQGHYGLMDDSGNILRDYEFDDIGYMYDGYACYKEDGKYGLIDSLGEIVFIAQSDEELYPFYDLNTVKVGSYYGLINKKGDYIIEPKQDYILAYTEKDFIVYRSTTESSGETYSYNYITNLKGELIYSDASSKLWDYYRGFITLFDNYGKPAITNINSIFTFLFEGKYDYIDNFNDSIAIVMKEDKFGAIMVSDAQTLSKLYVENKVNLWQKKDEFEKVTDYQKRVTEESRNEQAKLYYEEITYTLSEMFINTFSWHEYKISPYDSENESFLISYDNLGEIILHIPVNEAKKFKDNQANIFPSNPQLMFDGNKFILIGLDFVNDDWEVLYTYDATQSGIYANYNGNYNFKPLDFNYQTNNNYTNNYQKPNISTDPVDLNIPVTNKIMENTFAVVIGNENYKNEQKVTYAENDARIFKEYLVKTLGIPENRIHLLLNATLGEVLGEIDWLKKTAKAYEGSSKIIFYYAGHGMPEAESNEAYLLPVDGSSSNSKTGIKLSYLYDELSTNPTESTIVFLDACFSGASREGMLASGRGTRISPKDEPINGNLLVMSAANGTQTAHPYTEKSHGLFTYYLLLKLQQSEGNISYGELFKYVQTNVKRTAIEINKEQDPSIKAAPALTDKWESLKIK